MALIQCKLGPIETVVGSDTYNFRLDELGRAVAEVPNISHQLCFLSVEHYLVAPEITPAEAPAAEAAADEPPAPPVAPEPAATTAPAPQVFSRRGKRRQG